MPCVMRHRAPAAGAGDRQSREPDASSEKHPVRTVIATSHLQGDEADRDTPRPGHCSVTFGHLGKGSQPWAGLTGVHTRVHTHKCRPRCPVTLTRSHRFMTVVGSRTLAEGQAPCPQLGRWAEGRDSGHVGKGVTTLRVGGTSIKRCSPQGSP